MTVLQTRPVPIRRRVIAPGEGRPLLGMGVVVVALHLLGFGVLLGLVTPRHLPLGGGHPVFSVGVGLLAYTFGLRHAFDADHIAAVDNTIRKLITERTDTSVRRRPAPRPLSVGFWFSLGHSTVVFALALLLSAGVHAVAGQLEADGSRLHRLTGVLGASVSGTFLVFLGLLNLFSLLGVVRVFRATRAGHFDEAELEHHLERRGFMSRLLGGLVRSVRKPWHIYPIGLLFGLGFDTATEIGLLVLAGGAATLNLPPYAILVLPVLFAAAMCLMDTIDGIVMNLAYGWAFARPMRKIYYNLTVTSLSVAVALGVGAVEVAGVLADTTGTTAGPLQAVGALPLDYAGYGIVGLFVLGWLIALLVWRWAKLEAVPAAAESAASYDEAA